MLDHYLKWVEQLEEALNTWGSIGVDGEYRAVVVGGMGGSGVVGDYLFLLSNSYGGLPVIVVKNHVPPRFISDRDLVIAVSYSGNTLETISFVKKINRVKDLVIVSSNGFLEKYCLENNIVFIKVPSEYVPRTALPYMLYSVLGLLDTSGYTIVSRRDADKAVDFLRNSIDSILSTGREIAEYIYRCSRNLVLAVHEPYGSLGVRGKNEFNENSKIPVKVEIAPEWMHNDIVGWEKPFTRDYCVLAIRDPGDRVGSMLIDYMLKIYGRNGFDTYVLELSGDNVLEKILYGSMVLGVSSIYLAEFRGVDPLVTESIVEYKGFAHSIFG